VLEAARCVQGERERPLDPSRRVPEGAVAVAHNCPSGGFTYERLDGGAQESAPPVNTAHVRENGPLALRGELTVAGKGRPGFVPRCAAAVRREQALVRRKSPRRRVQASGEPATQGGDPLAEAQRPAQHRPDPERPSRGDREPEICSGHRAHRAAHPADLAVPLRRLVEQAVLRRHAREDRLRRLGADMAQCTHLDQVRKVKPRTPKGCEECLKANTKWVHLRLCLSCGTSAACDNSPGKHATKHFHERSTRFIRELRPGGRLGLVLRRQSDDRARAERRK